MVVKVRLIWLAAFFAVVAVVQLVSLGISNPVLEKASAVSSVLLVPAIVLLMIQIFSKPKAAGPEPKVL